MYTITTTIELPIAHCLSGAYSGLCCGNVYRNKFDDTTKADRYELNNKIFPIVHGHNYFVTINLSTNKLDENNMVIDFKLLKKLINNYFQQYDHSLILKKGNALVNAYIENFKQNNIDITKSRLFIWDEDPTAEYMSHFWHTEILKVFNEANISVEFLTISVEETSHNKITYGD